MASSGCGDATKASLTTPPFSVCSKVLTSPSFTFSWASPGVFAALPGHMYGREVYSRPTSCMLRLNENFPPLPTVATRQGLEGLCAVFACAGEINTSIHTVVRVFS